MVLVWRNREGEGAVRLAEKIRVAVAKLRHPVAADDIAITLSFGVMSHALGDDARQMLVRADAALRDAKRSGRNRVSCASQFFARN